VSLFVDTSVWSLALRRDESSGAPEVKVLRQALEGGDIVVTTGYPAGAAAGVRRPACAQGYRAASHCPLRLWEHGREAG
jgi:hypothetical protein